MKRLLFALTLTLFASPVFAQTAPCDAVAPTSGTVVVSSPMTVTVCHNATDLTGWALYDGSTRTTPTMIADSVVSATGFRQYSVVLTSPATASVHTYTMAAINAVGEGPKSSPFVLTVSLAPTAPVAPTKLVIR